jgi:hypothetical protein
LLPEPVEGSLSFGKNPVPELVEGQTEGMNIEKRGQYKIGKT